MLARDADPGNAMVTVRKYLMETIESSRWDMSRDLSVTQPDRHGVFRLRIAVLPATAAVFATEYPATIIALEVVHLLAAHRTIAMHPLIGLRVTDAAKADRLDG
jgi:hypothetical protein